MAVEIAEITGRCGTERGVLEPFICIDEAGDTYYLKGSNCTAHGSIAEWLATNLARAFELPVPSPMIARVDPGMVDAMDSLRWQMDLKYEYYFASAEVPYAQPPNRSQLSSVEEKLKTDIAVFDCWVNNLDRKLGNVNLLFKPGASVLHVIDFNNAFDSDFSIANLAESHVFGEKLRVAAGDMFRRQSYQERMEQALEGLERIIGQIPGEWIDSSTPEKGYIDDMKAVLTRFRETDFWGPLL